MKKLSDHCRESPALDRIIKTLVLSGSFDSFNSSVGRITQADETGNYTQKTVNGYKPKKAD